MKDVLTEAQSKQFDVLKDGEFRRDRIWKDCLAQARLAIKQYDDARMLIADLAIKACDKAEEAVLRYKYTLQAFAVELAIEPATLVTWVQARRVQIKLPSDRQELSIDFYRKLSHEIEKSDSKEKILQKMDRLIKYQASPKHGYDKYLSSLKRLEHKAHDAAFFRKADQETLSEISHLCSEIQSYVDQYIKGRSKYA